MGDDRIAEDSLKEKTCRRQKPKRYGRASRRRKAKLRSIQEAEERAWSGGSVSGPSPENGMPRDRDRSWPGVLERRSRQWSESDENELIRQLGYMPGNAVAVVARSDDVPHLPIEGNVPIVLQLYPLAMRDEYAGGKQDGRKYKGRKRGPSRKDGNDAATKDQTPLLEPFPTMYWVTHPILRTIVSKVELEEHHNATMMKGRLEKDPSAMASMRQAHRLYGETRWNLLTDSDQQLMEERNWQGALDAERGVAGIRHATAVKCLHAHIAHFLSGDPGSSDNIVGKWTMEQVNILAMERKKQMAEKQTAEQNATNQAEEPTINS